MNQSYSEVCSRNLEHTDVQRRASAPATPVVAIRKIEKVSPSPSRTGRGRGKGKGAPADAHEEDQGLIDQALQDPEREQIESQDNESKEDF